MTSEKEKYDRYITRTVEHIHRVQNNMVKIVTDFREALRLTDSECQQLMHSVMKHDRSKFSEMQFYPYIELTEYYHQRKKLGNKEYQYPSDAIKNQVDVAIKDHYHQENHHPERIENTEIEYTQLEAIETVCDLQAMAQEFGEGTCRGYFEKVWVPKHANKFPSEINMQDTFNLMDIIITFFEMDLDQKQRQG